MEAYEDMIRNTATEEAPWYVVPADNKWFTRLVVAAAIVETPGGFKTELSLRSIPLRIKNCKRVRAALEGNNKEHRKVPSKVPSK